MLKWYPGSELHWWQRWLLRFLWWWARKLDRWLGRGEPKALPEFPRPFGVPHLPNELTPGPWRSDGEVIGWWSGKQPAVRVAYEKEPGLWSPVAMCPVESPSPIVDAAFIAAARNALMDRHGALAGPESAAEQLRNALMLVDHAHESAVEIVRDLAAGRRRVAAALALLEETQ